MPPSNGPDVIVLGGGGDSVDALAGNDFVAGNGGDDTLDGPPATTR